VTATPLASDRSPGMTIAPMSFAKLTTTVTAGCLDGGLCKAVEGQRALLRSTLEFNPLIHTTRGAELSKEQFEEACRWSRPALHVSRDGQESLSTAHLFPRDSPGRHTRRSGGPSPSDCPPPSGEPEPVRGLERRRTLLTQAEEPWVIELVCGAIITLDIGLACADAYAVLARRGAEAAVVMDHRDTVVGVLANPECTTSRATRHLGGQEADRCSCASDVHVAKDLTPTKAVSPLGRVGDVMHACGLTVFGDTLLSEAASSMADHALRWLPVITIGGEVMGLLSAMDVVRWVGEFTGALPTAAPEISPGGLGGR
jgi:CBS domain-containing protein